MATGCARIYFNPEKRFYYQFFSSAACETTNERLFLFQKTKARKIYIEA